jgi:hypothetical protein
MLFNKFGLEIEKINMASSACHEKLNDPLGLGRVMRKPLKATNASFIKRITKCRLISEQASKSNTAQAATGIPKHLASVHAGIIKVRVIIIEVHRASGLINEGKLIEIEKHTG